MTKAMTSRAASLAAAALAAIVVALSVVPPRWRLVTVMPQPLEHLVIFGLLSLAVAIALPRRRAAAAVGLVVFAMAVEVVQVFAPGRHARGRDLAVHLVGIAIGFAIAAVIARVGRKKRDGAPERAV